MMRRKTQTEAAAQEAPAKISVCAFSQGGPDWVRQGFAKKA